MPTVSICSFPASEAFLADHDLVRSALQVLAGCDGVLSVYQGIDTDGKTGFIAAESTSYKAYKNVAGTETYNNIMDGLKPAMAGPRQSIHFESKNSPSAAFGAPITRICLINSKDEYTTEQVLERIGDMRTKIEGLINPAAFGESAQKPGTWGAVGGWESAEAYTKFREQEMGAKMFAEVFSLGETTVHQVKFEKFVA